MNKEFEMKDINEMSYFLEVKVKQLEYEIFMSQKKYAEKILSRFRMKDCNPVAIPAETGMELRVDSNQKSVNPALYKNMVESLMYLTFTRPDITYAVGLVNRYMKRPKQDHFIAAKRILRYVRDSDYGRDLDDRKGKSGYEFHIRSAIFSWKTAVVAIFTFTDQMLVHFRFVKVEVDGIEVAEPGDDRAVTLVMVSLSPFMVNVWDGSWREMLQW
ncbi:hypothetical protein RJ639_029667 [Escallonia herrerae]|uniref:Reverse transcriptase Ty1/copia-type domain-containing protein n=1 Tax=Escallonia herrerae TaxID=1293975 RepID=A0AA88X830_9ASTE|nr:hypothetical protein RJ639_029667 [Escallonia herrerae]